MSRSLKTRDKQVAGLRMVSHMALARGRSALHRLELLDGDIRVTEADGFVVNLPTLSRLLARRELLV
jgi:hypothetical protein